MNCSRENCIAPPNISPIDVHQQWSQALLVDPMKTSENSTLYDEKHKLTSSIKVTSTAIANLFSLPSQLLGTVGGIIAGGGAATIAFVKREDSAKAFSNSFKTGATSSSLFFSAALFPLTSISYVLSRAVGDSHSLARANILICKAISEDPVPQDIDDDLFFNEHNTQSTQKVLDHHQEMLDLHEDTLLNLEPFLQEVEIEDSQTQNPEPGSEEKQKEDEEAVDSKKVKVIYPADLKDIELA